VTAPLPSATALEKTQIHPLTTLRRVGTVDSITVGPPPTVNVFIGGDTTQTISCSYSRGYIPVVGDKVVTATNQGDHYVVGAIYDGTPVIDPAIQALIDALPVMTGGAETDTTTAAGRVSMPNDYGTATNVHFTWGIHNNNSLYQMQLISIAAATVTWQVVNTSTGAAAAVSQSVSWQWIGWQL
jgi:hypothetical protein